jgi:hypothetical protein
MEHLPHKEFIRFAPKLGARRNMKQKLCQFSRAIIFQEAVR